MRVARLVPMLLAGVLAACAGGSSSSSDTTIFAAASLTEVFTELGDAFMQERPDADLTFSFASSSDLARQVVEGAPADVFASADPANMAKVTDAGAASVEPTVFATNRVEIIAAPGNPLAIRGVEDLAAADLVVVVCAPDVPCGTYAGEVFAKAGIEVTPDSYENNVKAVAAKVVLGEADAGIVYATDVRAAGDQASGVEIPEDINVVAEYPIVATSDGDIAAEFVEYVTSTAGQRILATYGFGAP